LSSQLCGRCVEEGHGPGQPGQKCETGKISKAKRVWSYGSSVSVPAYQV
jgi:hypothetical protein